MFHANAIIDAVSAVAASSGYADAVVSMSGMPVARVGMPTFVDVQFDQLG